MKAQNTLGIKFIIRKNKMKDDKVPVYVSVTINGKRVELSLKQFVVRKHLYQMFEAARSVRLHPIQTII
jgi:hypothetical protein